MEFSTLIQPPPPRIRPIPPVRLVRASAERPTIPHTADLTIVGLAAG